MTYVNKRSVIAVAILLIVLDVLAVLARFHVRRKIGLGLDDWLCIPALVSLIGLVPRNQTLLQSGARHCGMFYHDCR